MFSFSPFPLSPLSFSSFLLLSIFCSLSSPLPLFHYSFAFFFYVFFFPFFSFFSFPSPLFIPIRLPTTFLLFSHSLPLLNSLYFSFYVLLDLLSASSCFFSSSSSSSSFHCFLPKLFLLYIYSFFFLLFLLLLSRNFILSSISSLRFFLHSSCSPSFPLSFSIFPSFASSTFSLSSLLSFFSSSPFPPCLYFHLSSFPPSLFPLFLQPNFLPPGDREMKRRLADNGRKAGEKV